MVYDVFISGFGGQGILLAGNLLAEAGLAKGLEVTFFPSYGVEMRGGTARATVVLSDQPIGSPIVDHPRCVIAMNQPSLARYTADLPPGGLLIVNSSLARPGDVKRTDIAVHSLPISDIAVELGNPRLANMVALGAFAALSGVISPEEVAGSLPAVISERNQRFIPLNQKAIAEGALRACPRSKVQGPRSRD